MRKQQQIARPRWQMHKLQARGQGIASPAFAYNQGDGGGFTLIEFAPIRQQLAALGKDNGLDEAA